MEQEGRTVCHQLALRSLLLPCFLCRHFNALRMGPLRAVIGAHQQIDTSAPIRGHPCFCDTPAQGPLPPPSSCNGTCPTGSARLDPYHASSSRPLASRTTANPRPSRDKPHC